MQGIWTKVLELLTGDSQSLDYLKMPKIKDKSNWLLKKPTRRELLQIESEIGRELFGPIPRGHTREFFHLDEKTWIWHEDFVGSNGKKQTSTIKYEIQEKGILKVQEGARYSYLDGEELDNLILAIQMYYEQVMRKVYNRDPRTGQKLV
jgi:hypothetical protein